MNVFFDEESLLNEKGRVCISLKNHSKVEKLLGNQECEILS